MNATILTEPQNPLAKFKEEMLGHAQYSSQDSCGATRMSRQIRFSICET